MNPQVFLCLFVGLTLSYSEAFEDKINSFTQSAEAVEPGGNITFFCNATASDAYWVIDNQRVSDSYPNVWVISPTIEESIARNFSRMKLVMHADSNNNNTGVTCFVHELEQERSFIIATPPTEPVLKVQHSNGGRVFTIRWDKPFTHPGFDIIDYSVEVFNTTDNRTFTVTKTEPEYSDRRDTLPNNCHEIVYTVTAHNRLGESSSTISSGFPISIAQVEITWRALYQLDDHPHLEFSFEPARSCGFQNTQYIVTVQDQSGLSLPVNESGQLYLVHNGLRAGVTYEIIVIAESTAGTTTTRESIIIREQLVSVEYISILKGVSAVLAVVIVILIATVVIFTCCLHRQKKALKKSRLANSLTETVVTPTLQRPTSLQPKCSTTNPIYAGGPVYESPNGEPLRSLLGGSTPSTPNTPLDSPRYTFEHAFSQRSAPDLPPPRKSSTGSGLFMPQGKLPGDVVKVEGGPAILKPGEDEYTVMNPVGARTGRANKPSPLSIPGLSAPIES